jgi:hypothetical protein
VFPAAGPDQESEHFPNLDGTNGGVIRTSQCSLSSFLASPERPKIKGIKALPHRRTTRQWCPACGLGAKKDKSAVSRNPKDFSIDILVFDIKT